MIPAAILTEAIITFPIITEFRRIIITMIRMMMNFSLVVIVLCNNDDKKIHPILRELVLGWCSKRKYVSYPPADHPRYMQGAWILGD